jgi:hypothetical protein
MAMRRIPVSYFTKSHFSTIKTLRYYVLVVKNYEVAKAQL